MPRPRPPGTLKQQCVRSIAKNMDKLWAKDYIDNWHGKSKRTFSFVLGPFEDLPGQVVELIIEELSSSKKMRKHHLQVLLVCHLEGLVLEKETDQEKAILLLISRCKNLRRFGLKSRNLPYHLMSEAFNVLNHLQYVDLSQTNVTDESLCVLASCSKHLRILNLSDTAITDKAITGLVFGTFHPPALKNTTDLCRTLVQLNVYGSLVTNVGLKCALIYMPNLQELNHSLLLSAVNDLSCEVHTDTDKDVMLQNFSTLSLRQLECDEYGFNMSGACCDASLITSAVLLCPFLRCIHFGDLINLKHDSLIALSNLSEVEDLMLYFEDGMEINFYEQILPLLQRFGNSLRKLQLRSVFKTNITAIACLCSDLQVLRLQSNTYYCQSSLGNLVPSLAKAHPHFQQLRILNINNNLGETLQERVKNQIPRDCLQVLLDAPRLEELLLIDQDGLSDDLLSEAVQASKFPYLKTIHLVACHNITVDSIWELMELNNPLSTLRLNDCKEITINDYRSLVRFAKKSKFTLDITWS